MIGLLVHVEDDPDPITDQLQVPMLTVWREDAWSLGVDTLLVVDTSAGQRSADLAENEGPVPLIRFSSLGEAEAVYPAVTWIYLEEGGQPLASFRHPAGNVIYAVGPNSVGFPIVPGRTYVEIPTVDRIGLWSMTAAAIVLFDRMAKTTSPAEQALRDVATTQSHDGSWAVDATNEFAANPRHDGAQHRGSRPRAGSPVDTAASAE